MLQILANPSYDPVANNVPSHCGKRKSNLKITYVLCQLLYKLLEYSACNHKRKIIKSEAVDKKYQDN